MKFILRYDNEYKQTFYLTRLGDWHNSQRLIAETNPSPEHALRFELFADVATRSEFHRGRAAEQAAGAVAAGASPAGASASVTSMARVNGPALSSSSSSSPPSLSFSRPA